MRSFAQMTLPLVLIMLLVAGCGRRSEPEVISEPPSVPRQDIKPSPTEVVAQFLNAIKSANYAKAYKYVNAPYTDRDGYINQMKNTLSDNDFSLQSYRMLCTQIYDRTSTVVVELGIRVPGFVEVMSGLDLGEQVVVGGLERLTEGAAVAPVEVERS